MNVPNELIKFTPLELSQLLLGNFQILVFPQSPNPLAYINLEWGRNACKFFLTQSFLPFSALILLKSHFQDVLVVVFEFFKRLDATQIAPQRIASNAS